MQPPEASLASRTPRPSLSPEEAQEALWFSEQVLPHEPMLRAWLRAKFPSLSDDDDVVQESYARLIRARKERAPHDPKAYLFSIARNVVLDLFRKRRTVPFVVSSEAERSAVAEERAGVVESVCSTQELELLRAAIDDLPERCRRIMTLRKLHGLSNQEIAERLGLSVNTVNAQLVIGLARCRRYLLARGVLRGARA
jgi:RNA polymerase sigma-70 factor (ECF subfamily)